MCELLSFVSIKENLLLLVKLDIFSSDHSPVPYPCVKTVNLYKKNNYFNSYCYILHHSVHSSTQVLHESG